MSGLASITLATCGARSKLLYWIGIGRPELDAELLHQVRIVLRPGRVGDGLVGDVDDRRAVHLDALGPHGRQQPLELRVLVFRQAPRVGLALEQAGAGGGGRDHQHLLPFRIVDRHRRLAGRKRADDRQDLVVLRELAGADGGLPRIRPRVEADRLDLLAVDAAGIVDLAHGDVEGCNRRLGRALQRSARRDDVADLQHLLRHGRRCGRQHEPRIDGRQSQVSHGMSFRDQWRRDAAGQTAMAASAPR